MKAVIVARVVDVVESEFQDKGGEVVKYLTISCIDEDAWNDKERVFVMTGKRELLGGKKPEELVGKYFQLQGNLTKDKGELKFKPESLKEHKAQE